MKKLLVMLFACLLLGGAAVNVDAQRKATPRKSATKKKTTARKPAPSIADPFKALWSKKNEIMEINIYQPTVEAPGEDQKFYMVVDGVYENGNRVDYHAFDKVVSREGNTVTLQGTCSYSGEPVTATVTYNPTTRKMTVEYDDAERWCYQNNTITFSFEKNL